MIDCPFKPFLKCKATAALIAEGRCLACPNCGKEIVNNPWDGFGSAVGYRPDEYGIARGIDSSELVYKELNFHSARVPTAGCNALNPHSENSFRIGMPLSIAAVI